MAKLKDGFYKQTAEAIGSDLYVLLAGGGSKPLEDFATSDGNVTSLGTSGNYLTWTKGGVVNNLTAPYATTADNAYRLQQTNIFSFDSTYSAYRKFASINITGRYGGQTAVMRVYLSKSTGHIGSFFDVYAMAYQQDVLGSAPVYKLLTNCDDTCGKVYGILNYDSSGATIDLYLYGTNRSYTGFAVILMGGNNIISIGSTLTALPSGTEIIPEKSGHVLKATQDSDGNAINTTYLKKSGGTITGLLQIKRNPSVIMFSNASDTTLGYLGFSADDDPVIYKADGTTVRHIIHSGNTYISNGTVTINGNSITPLTSLPSHVHTYIQSKDYYAFTASDLPNSFDWGVSAGFVKSDSGFGNFGSVLTVRTYTGGGGTLQLYAPYSKTYGGTRLKARFGNYDKDGGNSWTDLKEIAWISDIPTKTSQLTNDSGYLTSLPSHNHDGSYVKALRKNFTPAETKLTSANLLAITGGQSLNKTDWSYAGNGYIETDFGNIDLAGSSLITFGDSEINGYTQLFITAPTASGHSGITNEMIFYNNHGVAYYPAWTRVLTNRNYNSYSPKLDGTGASGTWNISISGNASTATSATSSTYSRNLLGRNTSGSDYGATDGNLIFAEWNTNSDNRWYLKAKGYETRVGYANDSDKLDGLHASNFYVQGRGAVDAQNDLQTIPKDTSGGWMVTNSGWTGMVAVLGQGHAASNRGIGFLFKGGQSSRINLLTQVDNTWSNRGVIAYTSDIPTVTNYYWADQLITSSAKSNTTPTFGSVNSTGLITAQSGIQIGSTSDIGWYFYDSRICAGHSVARGVNTGSLLVSNAWADSSKVPTNGIYSKGNIITPANVQALNLNLHGDWETDFGIHFNEGGDTKYGFSLLYGNSDLFKLVTRNNGTASTVLTVGRGSTQVDFKGKVTAGQFIANNTSGPHFTGTSASGNWAYLRLNNSSCLWDIATRSDSGSGGLWLSRYSGGDNGIFVSASSTPKVGINTSSPSYPLHVSGDIYTSGWSRAGNGFYIETTGVHYTSQGDVGEINLTANNEFLYSTSNGTMYFNYRAASRGTTVTNYIWNAGSSSSYATHTMGLAYFRGSGKYLRIGPQNGSHAHYETDATVSHWFNKTVQVDGNIEPYGNNEHSAGSTSYRFSNVYSYLGNFAGTVTISCAYPNIVCNASSGSESNIRFDVGGTTKGYVGFHNSYGTFLYNAAAVKYVYIANNGYFYTQSYINVGAGNEKNASNPPYVWGVNGSDNFMRTYATSSLSVGDSDKLDGEHGSRYTRALGGPNHVTVTVGGDAATYYPVVISSVADYYPMQLVNISRGYSETAPASWNTATHKGGLTLTLLWNGSRYWDGNSAGGACYCVYKNESYSTMVGGLGNSTAGKVVWLRGGGAVYHVHAMNGTSVTATVYTSTYTDSASQSFAPKTSASGVSVRWPGYAEGADYATSAGNADTLDGYHASSFLTSLPTHDHTTFPENTAIYFRHASSSWYSGIFYGTAGNECMSFVNKNIATSFKFWCGSDISTWTSSSWQGATGLIATIDSTGITAKAYYESSDERLKTFYGSIRVDLNKLKLLRKNYFKFNNQNKLEIGVSAQEIQRIYPEIVNKDDNGYLTVAYDKLSVIALKGIDELYDMILELRAENRQLRE